MTYPNIGERESYLLYHEELESLVKNFPTIKRARFWMTFGQEYLTHLRVIQNIGMARIDEVEFNGVKIVPLQFLKAVLPDPKSLGHNYHGETSIGCRIKGSKTAKNILIIFITIVTTKLLSKKPVHRLSATPPVFRLPWEPRVCKRTLERRRSV